MTSLEAAPSFPDPATPERPAAPLSTWALLKAIPKNSLGVLDEELYERLMVTRRYGCVTACFVSDPAGVKRVLVDNFENYPRVPTIRRLFEAEIGTGTLATEGEVWRRHRRIATPALDHRAIRPDIAGLIGVANSAADELSKSAGKKPIDVEKFAQRLVIRVLNQIATGGDEGALPIFKWLSTIPRKPRGLDLVPKPDWLSRLLVRRRLEGGKAEADAMLRGLIAARLRPDYDGPRDLFWRLANNEDRETGERLSAEEARDEAASIIAAGDTTIRPLTWVWYLLDQRPEIEARLHAELDAALGDTHFAPDDLSRLPFLHCVLDETMRLYPPVPLVLRQARARDEICGEKVPRGAIVLVAPFLIHRHRALWEDPDAFDPDRFGEGRRAGRSRFSFIPFATGPRVCPGSSASTASLLIAIAILARRFRFRLAGKAPVVPFGGISLQPKGGMTMRVERRR